MTIFRATDDYVEVAAIPERGVVELFFSSPGGNEHATVVRAHITEQMGLKLAFWLFWYWFWTRKMGFQTRKESSEQRKRLLRDAETERLHST